MDIDILAEDLAFPEGPVVCDDGSVIVVEIRSQQITRIRKDGSRHVVAKVEGGPNGLAFGPDGALYCCNNGGSRWGRPPGLTDHAPVGAADDYRNGWIERIDLSTGKVERLYEACDGIPLAGPNDIAFDKGGGFWFSDRGKDLADHERHGGLYYARPDGSSIVRVVYGLGLNGVGLSPDGATVYAAVTMQRVIMAFAASTEGAAAVRGGHPTGTQGRGIFAGRVVASFPGRQLLDSLAIEAGGVIAQAKVLEDAGIARVDPNSGASQTVPFPDLVPTNIAFGGADMKDAYVTLSGTGRLARTRWPTPGLRLPFNGA
jgi:gluconolactonase